MKNKILLKAFIQFVSLAFLGGCTHPFVAPDSASVSGLLVVDGHLYMEDKTAIIKLSRSQQLNDQAAFVAELSATISVEDDQGNLFNLADNGNGVYSASGLNVNYGIKYRVNIETSNQSKYQSDFVNSLRTPQIDTLKFAKDGGSNWQVLLNTHDPENKSIYYRWEYVETWEYTSGSQSNWVAVGKTTYDTTVVPRKDDIYHCWKTSKSTSVLINTTQNLSSDIVNDFVLNDNAQSSRKFDIKYSILVNQYVLEYDEYNFWRQLQKTTETTGSIFDSQPSQIVGNLHGITNKSEVVLGYFSPYSVAQKRLTRSYLDFGPDFWHNAIEVCSYDTVSTHVVNSMSGLLLFKINNAMGVLIGYAATQNTECVDCRSTFNGGGTNVEPDFMK